MFNCRVCGGKKEFAAQRCLAPCPGAEELEAFAKRRMASVRDAALERGRQQRCTDPGADMI
eukprot:3080851-Prymnesium_polylepis.1